MVVLQVILSLVVTIAVIALPIAVGFVLGRTVLSRLPRGLLIPLIMAGFAAGALYIALVATNMPPQQSINHTLSVLGLTFYWFFFVAGITFGGDVIRSREENKSDIDKWTAQLELDRTEDGSSLKQAYDLLYLGMLHYDHSRYDEALPHFENAYAIADSQLKGHPSIRPFLYLYSDCLRRAGRQADAEAIAEIRKSLPKLRVPRL